MARVLVVGAGIGGLALASALGRTGISAEIVERASTARLEEGHGLFLPGHASRALAKLGVGSAVAESAHPIRRMRVADHRARTLATVDLDAFWRGVGPCIAMRRVDLHTILLEAYEQERGRSEIRYGTSVASLALPSDDEPVGVEFTDSTSGHYDLVVGADGVNSVIRRLAFGDGAVRDVGQVSRRFLATAPRDLDGWTVRLGRGRAFLTVALGVDSVYCYADVNVDAARPGAGDWRSLFSDFAPPVPDLLAEADEAYEAPIQEVVAPQWTRPGVALIGDAAHATSPNMASGVAFAVEDALVLAECLTNASVGEAVTAYEARRRPRAAFAQAQAHRRDATRSLAAVIRDPIIRLAGRRIYTMNFARLRGEP